MSLLPVIDNISRYANFNNFSEKHIVWALSLPYFRERGSIIRENHQFEVECTIRILKTVFWHVVINGVIAHRKLPQIQGYHIFPSTRGVYLPKNHYENYSLISYRWPHIWGPGSRTIDSRTQLAGKKRREQSNKTVLIQVTWLTIL